MSTAIKFGPADWNLTDDEAKDAGRLTVSQEIAIQMALDEIGRSNGSLIGDEPGFGKTAIGAEFVLRAMRDHGWTSGLIIGLPDTHKQWEERIALQSDGTLQVRIMDGTKEGRANYAAFLKHEDGIYVAGSAYLLEKDWASERVPDESDPYKRAWLFERVKKDNLAKGTRKGDLILKDRAEARGMRTLSAVFTPREEGAIGPALEPRYQWTFSRHDAIGPAQEPRIVTKSVHQRTFARFHRKPLDFVMFDEVQAIANKRSNTKRTIATIKAGYRLGMSGTWFLNKLENMWSVTRWVWPGVNPATGESYVETNSDVWRKRYLVVEQAYGKNGKALETERGTPITTANTERIPGEFVATLPAYIRRENAPVPDAEVVLVPSTAAQAAQMAELEEDLMTWVLDWQGVEMPLVADLPMVLQNRLQQVAIAELSFNEDGEVYMAENAASAKLAPLRFLVDQHWAGQPVAIYTHSKIGAHFIAQRMRRAGYDARAWTGDLSRPEREKLKQQFLRGEFPYLISTIQSFGTGLDGFQRVCNKVAWISEAPGNVALNDQAIRRYFRPGMTERDGGFQHVKILMEDSIDVTTMEGLIEKMWRVRGAMNGGMAA